MKASTKDGPASPSLLIQCQKCLQIAVSKFVVVLLSHAHMDHSGNIGMLRKDIQIVASPESIAIMKGMQDTGVSSLESDTAYFSLREPTDDLGLYLSSVAGMSYQGRDFCCTQKPSEALTSFLSRKPGQDGKRAKKLDLETAVVMIMPLILSKSPLILLTTPSSGPQLTSCEARLPSPTQATSGCMVRTAMRLEILSAKPKMLRC
jgi:hypothetical protein